MGFKRGNTTSTLFTKIDKILKLLVDEIDNDQEIKRYFSYLSYEPLKSRSTDMNNQMMYQRDITTSMLNPQKIDISKTGTLEVNKKYAELPQILFPQPYTEEKISQNYCTLFVHNWKYSCDDLIGRNIFAIDILVPSAYILLKPQSDSRLHKIMERIAYLFDKVTLDEESAKELGNLEFKIIGTPIEAKVNKTNDITMVTIAIETKVINARNDGNGRMCK